MRLIREVLRLHYYHGLSTNLISRACGIARSTCQEYIKRFVSRGLAWPLPESFENTDLDALLFSLPPNDERKKATPDWKEIRREAPLPGHRLIEDAFRSTASLKQNLLQLVAEKRFREDFNYRVSVLPIRLPPYAQIRHPSDNGPCGRVAGARPARRRPGGRESALPASRCESARDWH